MLLQALRYLNNKIIHILQLCAAEREWLFFRARYCLQYSSIMSLCSCLANHLILAQYSFPCQIFNLCIWTSTKNVFTLLWLLFLYTIPIILFSLIYWRGPKFNPLSLMQKGIILGLFSCNKLSPSNSHYSQMELKELPKNQNIQMIDHYSL